MKAFTISTKKRDKKRLLFLHEKLGGTFFHKI